MHQFLKDYFKISYYVIIVNKEFYIITSLFLLKNYATVIVWLEVLMKVSDSIFLTTEKEIDFIIDELKLTSHFLIYIIDLIHRSYCPMKCLKISEIFIKCCLELILFFFCQSSPLFVFYCLFQEIFLAWMGNQKCCSLFQGFFCFQSIQDNQSSLLGWIHIECISQNDHHQWYDKSSPND